METFPRYWPFVRGIHRSPVNSQHKGQWRGALMFSLICVWINGWVNKREVGDLRRRRAHYDVIVMMQLQMVQYNLLECFIDMRSVCIFAAQYTSRNTHTVRTWLCFVLVWYRYPCPSGLRRWHWGNSIQWLVTSHQVRCILWVQVAIFNKGVVFYMDLCIEYIS